jgi:elongation factor G
VDDEGDVVEFDLESEEPAALTVAHAVGGEGRYVRAERGPGSYGHIRLALYPYRGARSYRFEWQVPRGALPPTYMKRAALEGVKEALLEPLPRGGRVSRLRVCVVDGSYHESDSDEQSVRIAAALAVREALARATLVEE